MSRKLSSLSDRELDEYRTEIARSAEAARVVGITVPVIEHAAEGAAAETSRRWWQP